MSPPTAAREKVFDDKLVDFLLRLPKLKATLKTLPDKRGKAACPRCGKKSLVLQLRGTKDHIWMTCRECNFKMIE